MRRGRHWGIGAAVLLAAGGASCRSPGAGRTGEGLPPPLPPDTVGISRPEEWRARDLYAVKCANCHRFYPPANYTDADWSLWMDKMSRKAKLDPDQDQLLRRYLGAFRSLQASGATVATGDPPRPPTD